MLERAQLALLNPSSEPALFRSKALDLRAKNELAYTPNAVRVQIKGPSLPEISVFDLPGAIEVHADPDWQHLVALIQKLLKNYIRDKQLQILLVLPFNQPPGNSTALRYVRECGAEHRAMGVLAMPDLIETGRRDMLCNLLSDVDSKLGRGWYVFKKLFSEKIEVEHDTCTEARSRKEVDFVSLELWARQNQYGIGNIHKAIFREHGRYRLQILEFQHVKVTKQLEQFPVGLIAKKDELAIVVKDLQGVLDVQ